MGQNRWWLKLFFYLLDVATFNSSVVYNETQPNNKHVNFVEFKSHLLQYFVGDRIRAISAAPTVEHTVVRMENRRRCAYCAVHSKVRRTRYMCRNCMIPLCCMGNGITGTDCFMSAHENQTIMNIVRNKFNTMQQKIKKQCNDTHREV